MKWWKKIALWALAILLLFSIIYAKELIFLTALLKDQLSLLGNSEDLTITITDSKIPSEIREQLMLVPKIMSYGDQLGFPKTEAYSSYIQLSREVFLHSLSAAKKDSFEEYNWYWPFIGALPYKGFIEKEDALREVTELKQKGYDTYLGESSAMSTLGLFNDPIMTTMISKNDSTVLINTIFHERTHQLFFRQNDVTFNENAATLIGSIASLDYLKEEFGEQSPEYQRQLQRIHDQIIFSQFINNFYEELDQMYSSNHSAEEKITQREIIFQKAKENFKIIKETKLQYYFKKFDEKEINNAYIISFYRYYGKLHLYYQVYEKLNRNTAETIEFFDRLAEGKEDPELQIEGFLS